MAGKGEDEVIKMAAGLAECSSADGLMDVLAQLLRVTLTVRSPAIKAALIGGAQGFRSRHSDKWTPSTAAVFGAILRQVGEPLPEEAAGGRKVEEAHDDGAGAAEGSSDGKPVVRDDKKVTKKEAVSRFFPAPEGEKWHFSWGEKPGKGLRFGVDNEDTFTVTEGGTLKMNGFGHAFSDDATYDLRDESQLLTVRATLTNSDCAEVIIGFSSNQVTWGRDDPGPDALTFRLGDNGVWIRTRMYGHFEDCTDRSGPLRRVAFDGNPHEWVIQVCSDWMEATLDGVRLMDRVALTQAIWPRRGVLGLLHYGGDTVTVNKLAVSVDRK